MKNNLNNVQKKLKIKFKDLELLKTALTHKSYLAEERETETNERLEFLGDAVLGLIVTNFIFHKFPNLTEGDLAKLRANIVNADALAVIAEKLNIGENIYMGKGTEQAGGRETHSILGNAIEALIGAIYLDKGILEATKFILHNFKKMILKKAKQSDYSDPKTALQELSVEKLGIVPNYRIAKEVGPYHDRIFHSEVFIGKELYGMGEGKSKKKAEQQAASKALKKLQT